MTDNIKIVSMIVLLVIIGFTFGFIYSLQDDSVLEVSSSDVEVKSNELVIVNQQREVPSNNLLVSDKYVGELKDGHTTVVVGKDGSLINVYDGVVLTRGVVVQADSGETQSVYRIDSPAKSLSME